MIPRKPHHKGLSRGKKTRKWDDVRRELKVEFEKMGVTRCEICGIGEWLSFAHRMKRRYIHTADELRFVALLCIPCHEKWEHAGHQANYDKITEIVENRFSS
jgi:hypothetical protein